MYLASGFSWSRGLIYKALVLLKDALSMEVQRLSFVCSTGEVCCPYLLWNMQNLGAVLVPPYALYRQCSKRSHNHPRSPVDFALRPAFRPGSKQMVN